MSQNFILFVYYYYTIFHTEKVPIHCKERKEKKNLDNWLKNKKAIQCQKMSKKYLKDSKFLV